MNEIDFKQCRVLTDGFRSPDRHSAVTRSVFPYRLIVGAFLDWLHGRSILDWLHGTRIDGIETQITKC